VALPFVYACGSALARAAVADRPADYTVSRWLAPGVTVAAWLVALHVVGIVTGSFHIALFGATILLALVGALAWFRRAPSETTSEPRALWIGAALATLAVAPLAFGWAFHDELFFTGHMSIAATIENGAYPPRHLTFPVFELRYHYGFDLLVAALSSILRLPTSLAIDVVTLAAWGYTFCLLWLLGERHLAPKSGWLVAVVTLFGAGIPFFSVSSGAPIVYRMLGIAAVGDRAVSPPFVSYFFQHPWTIGFPLALCALLVALSEQAHYLRLATLALLTLALAISQFVLFAALPLALIAGEIERGLLPSAKLAAAVAVGALAALPLGGFFAPSPEDTGAALALRAGIVENGVLEWHIASFGALLPLGVAGIWWTPRLRVVLGALVLGALSIVNFVRYTHSWDIVKFAAVAQLALSIGAAAAIARVTTHWRALLVAACTAAGATFVIALALRLPGIPEAVFHRAPVAVAAADADAISDLRPRVAKGEIVYRNPSATHAYAQWGGLPQPWIDAMTARFGFSEKRIGYRLWLLQSQPADPRAWLDEGITWFVLDPSDDKLRAHAAAWKATLVGEHGDLLIYHLEPRR
jgi:hypothetical protein